jgi:hypothetical protein
MAKLMIVSSSVAACAHLRLRVAALLEQSDGYLNGARVTVQTTQHDSEAIAGAGD